MNETTIITIIILIIWFLSGIISSMIMYNSMRKHWYGKFKEDYEKTEFTTLKMVRLSSILYILGGGISLIVILLMPFHYKKVIWWRYPKETL
tara:strand:- start:54455 stop:54730 length:276 start_codon:yes stop_codon:yes gene_type:complete